MTFTSSDYQEAATAITPALRDAKLRTVILSALRIAAAAVAYVEAPTPRRELWVELERVVKNGRQVE